MTTIQSLSAQALERVGIAPSEATWERIDEFARTLDQRAAQLDALDRFELQNAAVEYTINWVTAEFLEAVCGQTGPINAVGRANPCIAQAATARTRMRQIWKAIKSLLKAQPEEKPAHTDATASACPPSEDTREPEPLDSPTSPPTDITTPEKPETPELPAAPPMNRAQRRAQARLETKRCRKAEKRLYYQERNKRDSIDPAEVSSRERSPSENSA